MSNTIVIGANFGDEGKGLITDFETRRLGAKFVARSNGGAQAGHTVVTNDGKRHVFGHLSAGTFAGAYTYLSADFLVNPLVFQSENKKLAEDKQGVVACHPKARISTIYDMAVNGLLELSRGSSRHGSCGLGINETVTRHANGYALTLQNLKEFSDAELENFFAQVHTKWLPARFKQLKLDYAALRTQFKNDRNSEAILNLLDDADYAKHAALLRSFSREITPYIPSNPSIVFEGAQGLALDEEFGNFPHVTRSITGALSALKAAQEVKNREVLQTVYVTRCYLTRHGAGPLAYEGEPFTEDGATPIDATNVHNEWQGTIRYAPLNLPQLHQFIQKDIARARSMNAVLADPTIAVTCLDQVGSKLSLINLNNEKITLAVDDVPSYISKELNLKLSHVSYGPTAKDVIYNL